MDAAADMTKKFSDSLADELKKKWKER